MRVTTDPLDCAILTAQLAFIRRERRVQASRPHLFRDPNGHSPSSPCGRNGRAQALAALIDGLTDAAMEQLRQHPAWPGDVRTPLSAVVTLATVSAIRSGRGVTSSQWQQLQFQIADEHEELGVRGAFDLGDLARASGLITMVAGATGAPHYWPTCFPREVIRDASC